MPKRKTKISKMPEIALPKTKEEPLGPTEIKSLNTPLAKPVSGPGYLSPFATRAPAQSYTDRIMSRRTG